MIDRSKKYKKESSIPQPHVGEMLTAYIQMHKINRAALARQLGVAENAISDYCRRSSLQLGILWRISVALEYNFFTEFNDKLPFAPESATTIALKQQLAEKEETIAKLEAELEIYRRIVGK